MSSSTLLFTLIPVVAAIAGAAVAVRLQPGPTLVSAIQHFAAGVVFAAAAAEILPGVVHGGSLAATLAFTLVLLATLVSSFAQAQPSANPLPAPRPVAALAGPAD